jgi:pantoate--beta-alanine ligase
VHAVPQRLTEKDEFRALLDNKRAEGRTIGVVGTSGGLHAGHLSLVERSVADGNFTVLWLFTSRSATPYIEAGPMPAYDRDYDRDERVAMEAGIGVLFRPGGEALFPLGPPLVRLQVAESLAEPWPGSGSAVFVNMVAMMVCKELNVVGPCRLYCGEKDWQTAAVLRRMVADMSVPAEIVVCPTVREPDGVVLGSRNVKLLPEERARAAGIKPALAEAVAAIEAGAKDPGAVERALRERLSAVGTVEYAVVVDADSLQPVRPLRGSLRVLVSVAFSNVSLTDNVGAVAQEART